MAQLIYATPTSLDGFIASHNFEWSAPNEEELIFITDVMRPIGTYLFGRKMYETMLVWETPEVIPGLTPAMRDYAKVWQAADKIVYSQSLGSVPSRKSRQERQFDPQAIRKLKSHSPSDISVGGPNLAAQAIRAGVVDEYHLFVVPKMIGGGIPVMPRDINIKLDLLDERRFGRGWMYLRYRTQV
jgi:dihydrofolate reductase